MALASTMVKVTAAAILLLLQFAAAQEPDCFEEGECTRSLVLYEVPTIDSQACLEECQSNMACQFFTYYVDQGVCLVFGNCEDFSEGLCDREECFSGSRDCDDLQCFSDGRCIGTLIDETEVEDGEECLELCQDTGDCNWFTYDSEDGACLTLETCTLVDDDTCSECVSGQRQCQTGGGEGGVEEIFSAVAVVAGNGASGYDEDVEAVDLQRDGLGQVCDTLPDYPFSMGGATGALFEGVLKVCGGNDGSSQITVCLDLLPGDTEWTQVQSMLEGRYSPSSSVIGGEWFITGGFLASAQTSSASTEVWDGSSFRRSLPLPTPMEFHCQVSLNDTHVFISDVYSSLGTYILDWNDGDPEQYVQVPSPSGRFNNGPCGLATRSDGRREVVVVAPDIAEIFDVEELEWRKGPELPELLDDSFAAQLESTFLVLGGRDGSVVDSSIYQYDPEEEDWIELDQTLEVPRDRAVAVALTPEFVSCDGKK